MRCVSASLVTALFGMPIPLPVMTLFIRGLRSCVRLCVERKKIVGGEIVLAAAELTDDLGVALFDHLLQLGGRKQRQRRQGPLAAAAAAVSQRHVEARID